MSDRMMAYFGYGSLVNLHSLRTKYIAAYPARLNGWRRHWQARPSGDATSHGFRPALLSVHRHPDSQGYIDGMLIVDNLEHLPALDERELHYKRMELGDDLVYDRQSLNLNTISPEHCFIYVASENPDDQSPLLQSYLDVVMSGFYVLNGPQGVEDFIASTIGFNRSIIADRHDPHYPRAVVIEEAMAEWFDELLLQAGVQFG